MPFSKSDQFWRLFFVGAVANGNTDHSNIAQYHPRWFRCPLQKKHILFLHQSYEWKQVNCLKVPDC
jgi:hypothetical protein